jgi:hypothetical protein
MNALDLAQEELSAAESAHDKAEQQDGNAYWRGRAERHYNQAAVYAAVAQAEQLKRIADMMEGYLAVYADPAVFSGSDKHDLHH